MICFSVLFIPELDDLSAANVGLDSVEIWEDNPVTRNLPQKRVILLLHGNKVSNRWYLQYSLLWTAQDPMNQKSPIAYKNG